jgi:insertion element IS1 protein InsB
MPARNVVVSSSKNPQFRKISDETKAMIDRLLLERLSLAGIARVTGVSERWLQDYVNQRDAEQSREAQVSVKKRRLVLQCDEMWSFVGKRKHKVWLWIALDAATREVVALHVGDRSRQSAQALWQKLLPRYRECAILYTDEWEAYQEALPSTRHRIVHKGSGLTNYVERFNNTLRQRLARLTRETLSFSKKLANHIGAIWFFIHHYNAQLAAR